MPLFIIFCKFIISAFELFCVLITAFTLFRFPIRYNLLKIGIIAAITSFVTIYNFHYFPNIALMTNITCETIAIMFLFTLPFFYSLLIAVIGMLLGATFEYTIVLAGTNLKFLSVETLSTNILQYCFVYVSTAALMLIVSYFLHKTKIGFMFMTNKMTVKNILKKYNIIIAGVLLIFILCFQLVSMSFNKLSVHSLWLLALLILFISGTTIVYKQNKMLLHEKYERLKNRK
jgi:hypothetical protein